MKKGLFSKFVIAFVITANSLFAMAVLQVYLKTQSEPAVLIGVWFSFTTAEVWQLAQIKRVKESKKNE